MKDNLSLYNEMPLSAIVDPLLQWFQNAARVLPWRADCLPYHIWVSEIMLQQTRVEAVKPYYMRFMQRLPDIAALAAVSQDELLKLWEGLGYYSRARNLKKAAELVCTQYHGIFPREYELVRALPGIGEYTAGAICSIAFGQPTPAVDGNVLRVLSRICKLEEDIAKQSLRKDVREALSAIYPQGQCAAFTQSLMELGALVCTPNGKPLCECCPLSAFCGAHADGVELLFPVRAPKAARKKQEYTVFLLYCEGKLAVRKQTQKGLLHGLWALPMTEGNLSKKESESWLQKHAVASLKIQKGKHAKHIFTHIEWEMNSYIVECENDSSNFTWVTPQQLAEEIALPTAFRKLL